MSTRRYLLLCLWTAVMVLPACKSSRKSVESSADIKGNRNIAPPLSKNDLELIYYFHNATREKLLGNYEEAIRNYRKCLNIEPRHAPSCYELGIMFLNAGDDTNAEAFGKVAYQSDPSNTWYALFYVEALKHNRKYSDAIKVYENLEKRYPERREVYIDHSNTCLAAGKNGAALEVLDKLEKITGPSIELVGQKQKIYLIDKKPERALSVIKEYIEQQPEDHNGYLLLAETYEAMDRPDDELAQLKLALQKSPGDPEINLSIAEFYRMKRDYDSSMPYLRDAFSSTDLDIDSKIKILLGLFLVSENNKKLKEDAYSLLDAAIIAHPNDPKIYSMYGDFCFRDKRYEKSRDSFRKAIELDNSKFAIWSQLLIVESELGDFDAMVKEAQEARDIFPNEPSVLLFLGIAQLQKKQPADAVRSLNEGLQLVVDNPPLEAQFQANLGDAYYRTKQYGKSDDAYEAALKINPKDTYVLNNYAYYLSLRKENLSRAAEMSKQTVDMQPGNASYLDTYGWILYTQEKYTEAEQWLIKAVKATPKPGGVILEHYGDVLYKLRDENGALDYWRKAKEAGSASEFLDQKIREIKLIE